MDQPTAVAIEKVLRELDHYTAHQIQPIEYVFACGIGPEVCLGNIIKYLARYPLKNGLEDLKKAKVYLDWMIEFEETGKITVGGKAHGSSGSRRTEAILY
jgi:hypothetical protein